MRITLCTCRKAKDKGQMVGGVRSGYALVTTIQDTQCPFCYYTALECYVPEGWKPRDGCKLTARQPVESRKTKLDREKKKGKI